MTSKLDNVFIRMMLIGLYWVVKATCCQLLSLYPFCDIIIITFFVWHLCFRLSIVNPWQNFCTLWKALWCTNTEFCHKDKFCRNCNFCSTLLTLESVFREEMKITTFSRPLRRLKYTRRHVLWLVLFKVLIKTVMIQVCWVIFSNRSKSRYQKFLERDAILLF